MPSLIESINSDRSGYGPVPEGSGPQVAASQPSQMPANSGWTRGPLPILSQQSDTTRLFYSGTGVMQTRILNLPAPQAPVDLTATNKAIQAATNLAQKAMNQANAANNINPAAGFSKGQNANGFFTRSPVGEINQWNSVALGTSTVTVTFPTAFSNLSSIVIQLTPIINPSVGSNPVAIIQGSITLTSFQIVGSVVSQNVGWVARGF